MDNVFKANGIIIDRKDRKYFIENPGKDFSPERNKAIVEETIQEATKYLQTLQNIKDDGLGERIDIMSDYAMYKFGDKQGSQNLRQYLGKDLHDKLIGERILEKVRIADSVNRIQGNRKHSILI